MIIALDTASTDISLAIADADGTIRAADGWSSDRRQGHETLLRLVRLLAREGRALEGVTALAVGIGPGSFTGLRVGMSLAKGLALALSRPLLGVPSLPAWLDAEPEAAAALARAGAREAYVLLRGEVAPRIVDRDELPSGTASAPIVAPHELAEAFGLAASLPPYRAAAAIAATAAVRLRRDPDGDDLSRLEPAYLRAPRGVRQVSHVEVP